MENTTQLKDLHFSTEMMDASQIAAHIAEAAVMKNDICNNCSSFGFKSFAIGNSSIAGSHYCQLSGIDIAQKKLYVDSISGLEELQYSDNILISYKLKNNYDAASRIISVLLPNIISVDEIPQNLTTDDKSSISSSMTAHIWFPGHPELGTRTDYEGVATTIGAGNISQAYSSLAVGYATVAAGRYSVSQGTETTAFAYTSHAEGKLCKAFGQNSHAEGLGCVANGGSSHAEGYYSRANGQFSHSEGLSSVAIGTASHSEGFMCESAGSYSHATGYMSKAIGDYSTASGDRCISEGKYSIAIGRLATAKDERSAVLNFANAAISSHGAGTITLNTDLGISGIYVGDVSLYDFYDQFKRVCKNPDDINGNVVVCKGVKVKQFEDELRKTQQLGADFCGFDLSDVTDVIKVADQYNRTIEGIRGKDEPLSSAAITHFNVNNITFIGAAFFENCKTLKKVEFPNAVECRMQAFWGTSLSTVEGLETLRIIGGSSFRDLSTITEIDFPYATTVDYWSMSGMKSLSTLNIPNVQFLGHNFIHQSNNVKILDFSDRTDVDSVPVIDDLYGGAFNGCHHPLSVYVPTGKLELWQNDAKWKDVEVKGYVTLMEKTSM